MAVEAPTNMQTPSTTDAMRSFTCFLLVDSGTWIGGAYPV